MYRPHPIKTLVMGAALLGLLSVNALSQRPKNTTSELPVRYEELNATQFAEAVARAGGICIIPVGILEKHGPHLPLGTDLLDVRETVLRAASLEYCVIFPEYFCGQIFEARHQPGTIAYSTELQWNFLQETCDELGRNGFTKIVLVNGHGGNTSFLTYFCQAQLANRKPYSVFLFSPGPDTALENQLRSLRKTTEGGHADEIETSRMMAHRPDLAHPERAAVQSGENLARLSSLPFVYTGIWWYARYPNHYAGDGSHATREIGDLVINSEKNQLATMLKALKKDRTVKELEEKFFDSADRPLQTKQ